MVRDDKSKGGPVGLGPTSPVGGRGLAAAPLIDPYDALSVLAFVLCPAGVFTTDPDEVEQVRAFMRPVKARAVRRFVKKLTRQ
jgi:hypothetical protein